jgi:hypothetical protein
LPDAKRTKLWDKRRRIAINVGYDPDNHPAIARRLRLEYWNLIFIIETLMDVLPDRLKGGLSNAEIERIADRLNKKTQARSRAGRFISHPLTVGVFSAIIAAGLTAAMVTRSISIQQEAAYQDRLALQNDHTAFIKLFRAQAQQSVQDIMTVQKLGGERYLLDLPDGSTKQVQIKVKAPTAPDTPPTQPTQPPAPANPDGSGAGTKLKPSK